MANVDRFFDKVIIWPSGCWVWIRATSREGYGRIGVDGKSREAYRVAYEWFIGPVPEGMVLHHECKAAWCVNPYHMSLTTPEEHQSHHRKTHCIYGHELSPENTRILSTKPGRRICKTCESRRAAEYYQRRIHGKR